MSHCDCSTTEGESELSTDQGTEQLPIIYLYKGAANILLLYSMGWAITLTLYLLFTGALALLFSHLAPGLFLVKELLFGKECWCLVAIELGLGPGFGAKLDLQL